MKLMTEMRMVVSADGPQKHDGWRDVTPSPTVGVAHAARARTRPVTAFGAGPIALDGRAKAANQSLSDRRASAVKAALALAGVEPRRISAKGMGMSQPVADNGTADGRQKNRRTDIIVLNENVENIGCRKASRPS